LIRELEAPIFRGEHDRMVVCMLNPSTADEHKDDPTIRRVIGFATRERCRVLEILNLYALCTTDPCKLLNHPDPVGPDNDQWIQNAVASEALIVVAWGSFSYDRLDRTGARAARVLDLLATQGPVYAWDTTLEGYPRHPLYLPRTARREVYTT
jgi:hypothetical protein